jgi:hypothetical protein
MGVIGVRSLDVIWRWCLLVVVAASCCIAETGPQGAASIDLGGVLSEAAKSAHATSVVEGKARFQALSPSLVRMEYSLAAQFVDAPSQSVVKRDWPNVALQTRREGGWLIIDTGKMTVRYQIGTGAFTAANLEVKWNDAQGEHTWKPGDKDDENLGGTHIFARAFQVAVRAKAPTKAPSKAGIK